jgi:cation transport ATPase
MAQGRQRRSPIHDDEKALTTVADNLSPPITLSSAQRDVKWSAQSETSDERAFRVKREEAETVSRLRREEVETQHKLNEERDEAKARRRNQLIGLCIMLGMVLILFGTCVWIVFSQQYADEVEKWATITLSSILTGTGGTILGYAIGKVAAK